jgi:dTMP kinase
MNIKRKKGILITFEGIDSSGKSTQIERLKNKLIGKNYNVEIYREPGGTEVSEKIRLILLDKSNSSMASLAELFLYEASRAQLVKEKIIPALNSGKIVICDRYADSSYAYQGFGRGINLKIVEKLNLLATCSIKPDLTFVIDLSYQESQRRKGVSEKDRLESSGQKFYEMVRKGYKNLAKKNKKRIYIINGESSVEEIENEIWGIVKKKLNKRFKLF